MKKKKKGPVGRLIGHRFPATPKMKKKRKWQNRLP
jgi:hypothetical protein